MVVGTGDEEVLRGEEGPVVVVIGVRRSKVLELEVCGCVELERSCMVGNETMVTDNGAVPSSRGR